MEAPGSGEWALVTNDDGIAAPGLRALAAAAVATGLDVVVAAPALEASGAGSSIMAVRADGHVRAERHDLAGLAGVPAFGVAGHPSFIAFAALSGWFDRPPALVLSGINFGANLGTSILHSGTVGAALTAARLGARALAVSLDCDHAPPGAVPNWDNTGALLPSVLEVLAATPAGTTLTLNLPDLPADQLGELRAAPLANRNRRRGQVSGTEGGLRVSGVQSTEALEPGHDAALLDAGHPTLTAVRPVSQDTSLPLDDLLVQLVRNPA